MIDAIATLRDACKASGDARADLQAEEVLLLVGFLWRIEADDDWATRTSRMLDLVMDALASPQTPSRAARK